MAARKTIDKGLLKNIIKHTDAHNKIQEQNEMWKQWELKKQSHKQTHSPHLNQPVSGYMRSDVELPSGTNEESLKWNRLLMEYEETCKNRWGHSGYKELYPEEFDNHESNKSDVESNSSNGTEKPTEIKTDTPKRKRKNAKKEKLKKKRKLNSDSSDIDLDIDRKHKKKKSLSNQKHRDQKHNHSRSNDKKSIKKRKKRTKE